MADLQIFRNESFGEIRTLNIDGEPWFVGKDVADSLGYERSDNAIRNHVDEEDKLTHQISASGQNRNMVLINESGLYSLIMSSKLPSAKQFKRWVTNEVLPSIRKHGVYATAETAERLLNDPDFMIQAVQNRPGRAFFYSDIYFSIQLNKNAHRPHRSAGKGKRKAPGYKPRRLMYNQIIRRSCF